MRHWIPYGGFLNGRRTPKHVHGCSIINHPFWGTPIVWNLHIIFQARRYAFVCVIRNYAASLQLSAEILTPQGISFIATPIQNPSLLNWEVLIAHYHAVGWTSLNRHIIQNGYSPSTIGSSVNWFTKVFPSNDVWLVPPWSPSPEKWCRTAAMAGMLSPVITSQVSIPCANSTWFLQPQWLVGGWALPLWKMMEFVSWDDDIPNWRKHKIHLPNHQPAIDISPTKIIVIGVMCPPT